MGAWHTTSWLSNQSNSDSIITLGADYWPATILSSLCHLRTSQKLVDSIATASGGKYRPAILRTPILRVPRGKQPFHKSPSSNCMRCGSQDNTSRQWNTNDIGLFTEPRRRSFQPSDVIMIESLYVTTMWVAATAFWLCHDSSLSSFGFARTYYWCWTWNEPVFVSSLIQREWP
jgi:hypothetical protein